MSAADKTQQRRREDVRQDVLAHLAQRAPNALQVNAIRERINRDMRTDYDPEEIEAALSFLEGLKWVECIKHAFGADHHYRATSEGVLQYERSRT